MNYSYSIGLLLLFFSLSSCDEDNYLDVATNYDTESLQIKGAYQGPDEEDFVDFEMNIGKLDVNHQYLYWGADVSEGELGPTLIAGVYTSANKWYGSVRYFGLQFWSDQLPANRRWTSAELEHFFAPGNVFELGQGPGLVDIAYRYPGVEDTGALDDISSKSSFLENPAGQLVITKVEEYQFTGTRLTQNSPPTYDGKLVSCLINAEVGLNRNTPTQGNTVSLVTDEVLTLRNVEVTFFVSY